MKTLYFFAATSSVFLSFAFFSADLVKAETSNTQAPAITYDAMRAICNNAASPERQGKTFEQCRNEVMGFNNPGTISNQCQTDATALQTATNSFNSACARAGMTSGNGRTCLQAARCCAEGGGPSATDAGDPSMTDCSDSGESSSDEDVSDRDDRTSTVDAVLSGASRTRGTRSSRPSARVRRTRARYAYCPSQAGDDLTRAEEQATRADEKAATARDRLEEAQQKLVDAQTKQSQDREDIEKEMSDLQQSYEDEVKRIQDGLKESNSALQAEIAGLAQDLQTAEANLRTLHERERRIWDAFIQAGMAQRSRCHSEALAAVTNLRVENGKKAAAGRLTSGGFNSVLRGSGLTDIQRGNNLVENLRRRCTGDDNYKSETRVNQMRRDADLRQLADERATANGQVASIQAQIASKRDSAPELVQTAMRDLQRISQRSQQNLQRLQQRSQRLERENASKIALAQQSIQRLQRQLEIAERHERDYNSLLDLANSTSSRSSETSGSSTTTGGASGGGVSAEAEALYSQIRGTASNHYSTCCCNNVGGPGCSNAAGLIGSTGTASACAQVTPRDAAAGGVTPTNR